MRTEGGIEHGQNVKGRNGKGVTEQQAVSAKVYECCIVQ